MVECLGDCITVSVSLSKTLPERVQRAVVRERHHNKLQLKMSRSSSL